MKWEQLRAEAEQVLSNWFARPVAGVQPIEDGTLNWNFHVATNAGDYVLRCHRDNLESERIEGEHALLAWVVERGIPAPVPVLARSGQTLIEGGGHRWSLARRLPGRHVPRGTFAAAQARALGEMHGKLQSLLASHPESQDAGMTLQWDIESSKRALAKLVEIASERGEEEWVVAALRRQRELLDGLEVLTTADVVGLPRQLLHGDFHDQQVLVSGNEVSAVLDWEIWRTDPRAWELVRALSFSKILNSPRQEDYLAGYCQHIRLTEDEARLALRLWFQSRIVGVWAWWACFVEGNERVRDFFPDMAAEVERVADPAWCEAATVRFVLAACG